MAKKKTSPVEDLIELVAILPWWAGVALAAVSYVVLHRLAVLAVVTSVQPGQVGGLMLRTMFTGLAYAGQFLIPLICLFAAGVSFWNRRHRQNLVSDVAQAKGASALDGMSWREFEMLVGEAFRLQGYSVVETGGGGADGGVDLALTKGNEKFLVQCKQWKAYKVGVDVVRELYGVMVARGATGGFVVTSGSFTTDAKEFADGRNVKLVDGQQLFGLIKQAQVSLGSTGQRAHPMPATVAAKTDKAPSCPVCESKMVKRTATKGRNAGSQFWGCSRFPSCRGIVKLRA